MKPTDALKFQFYWYYDSCVFRAAFLPIIRSSQLYIVIGTFYADVMTVCYQEQDGTQRLFCP